MPTRDSITLVHSESVSQHPAVKAWQQLQPNQPEPKWIAVLKPEQKRSAVYRLGGIGPTGSTVIAKRGRAERLTTEIVIYSEVLPHLSLPTLRFYGSVEDSDPVFRWLFLEDAGDERFRSSDREHRELAARWLAALHSSARWNTTAKACLPKRGLNYYREIISQASEVIRRSLANASLGGDDLATLYRLMAHCEVVVSGWSDVEELWREMPATVVHGDFSAKNVRTRRGPNGLELLPIDWDAAGWGIAALDFWQTDLPGYWAAIRPESPDLTLDALRRQADVGRICWAIEPITGEAAPLAGEWTGNVMRKMRAYETEITCALQSLGWRRG
jgi:hypothetical protein